MKRREFIRLFGGAAMAWPFSARAQAAVPVVGILTPRGAGDTPQLMQAIRQGLKDAGFIEGQNVAIEYRFAENDNERLPALAADLVKRQVNVIAATSTPAALAARAATTTIPVVFETALDPVRLGLVPNLNRPAGNITGVTSVNTVVAPKRLELLHELRPNATVMALLVNPANPALAESQSSSALSAARSFGIDLHILHASTEAHFDGVFADVIQMRAGGLVIMADPFFTAQQERLAARAVQHAVPAIYENREFVAAGGLMSYGGSQTDAYRLVGAYAARILKGEKTVDLPVQQATKVELYINLKTAKALGISVPIPILGRADEVIE